MVVVVVVVSVAVVETAKRYKCGRSVGCRRSSGGNSYGDGICCGCVTWG